MTEPDPQYEAIREQLKAGHDEQLVEQLHDRYLELARGGSIGGLPYPDPTDQLAEGADAIRALAEAVAAGLASTLSNALAAVAAKTLYELLRGEHSVVLTAGGYIDHKVSGVTVWTVSPSGELTLGAVPAARITGELALARIPDLPAAQITSGTFPAARVQKVMNLNGVSYGTGNPSGGADGDIYFRLV